MCACRSVSVVMCVQVQVHIFGVLSEDVYPYMWRPEALDIHSSEPIHLFETRSLTAVWGTVIRPDPAEEAPLATHNAFSSVPGATEGQPWKILPPLWFQCCTLVIINKHSLFLLSLLVEINDVVEAKRSKE